MKSIAIVGVGLIGGSFALGLRKAGFSGPILGVSSERTVAAALAAGVIDRACTLETAAAEVDVLYLSQPIHGILRTIDALAPLLRPGCLVTDAGSTKVQIVERAAAVLPRGSFLGGHPMAGKEARGVASADPDLFRGRPYIFTTCEPHLGHTPAAGAFVEWTQRLGAVPVMLDADEHDTIVGFTSHLPQLASTALAAVLSHELTSGQYLQLAGPGLRDTTRLALSSYDIWHDIVQSNTAVIDHALEVYIDKLIEMRDNLQTPRLGEMFSEGADAASRVKR